MVIVEINALAFGSTGNIMFQIANVARRAGDTCYTFSSKRKSRKSYDFHYYIDRHLEYKFHLIEGSLLGDEFHFSYIPTMRLIAALKRIKPDIVHLHIIHGYYLNIPMLFKYLKKMQCKVVWTLHDCWALTGRCPHFILENCDKWKTKCEKCTFPKKKYPSNFWGIDLSTYNFREKKKFFLGFKNLTIVTPSNWLAKIVKQSFMKDYPVEVINNGINHNVFYRRMVNKTDKGLMANKNIILGVANSWGDRKGLDIFVKLSQKLDLTKYQIVLIGTSDKVDKELPHSIKSIHRTTNQNELAEYYSIADVFVNPTREDTFPTVNMEALACGTPVVTFDTGGSSEIVDEKSGIIVPVNDIDALVEGIALVCEEKKIERDDCVKRSLIYDMQDKFNDYVKLYHRI